MPNHVTTKMTVSGPTHYLKAFQEACLVPNESGDLCFDFNSLIPMPECLRQSDSSSLSRNGFFILSALVNPLLLTENAKTRLAGLSIEAESRFRQSALDYLDKNPDVRELGYQALKNYIETGYTDWYQWSIDHWGTKWNSYDFEFLGYQEGKSVDLLVVRFNTAWSFPEPVLIEACRVNPKLHFSCVSFDDMWNFAGRFSSSQEKKFIKEQPTKTLYHLVYGKEYEQ